MNRRCCCETVRSSSLIKAALCSALQSKAITPHKRVPLEDGDCLLFYTDGLIDAANFDGQLWGKDRLLDVAKQFTGGSAEQMAKNILFYRRRFVGLAHQIDDTSMVIVKVDRRPNRSL